MIGPKRKNCSIGVVFCLFAALFATQVLAQNSVIKGTVKNGTTGNPANVESVSLLGLDAGMQVISEISNVSGDFTFNDVRPSGDTPYLVQAVYKGVTYNALVSVPNANETVSTEILVYETTDNLPNLVIQEATYQFRMTDNVLNVSKNYVLMNETDSLNQGEGPRTLVNNDGTFKFRVPETSHGIESLQVNSGLVPINESPIATGEPGVYAINTPIRPGVTQVTLAYHVDYVNKIYGFSENLIYDMHNIILLTAPADMRITGEGIANAGGEAHRDFNIFTREHLNGGENLSFTVIGGSPAVFPIATPTTTLPGKIMTILTIFVLLVLGVVMSRNKSPAKQDRTRGIPKKYINRKNEHLEELAILDDRFSENHISESEYQRKRALVKNQLIELYNKIQKST